MTIKTNLNKAERKPMIKSISEALGIKAIYLGPPSFAFNIGTVHVSVTGDITCDDAETWEKLLPYFESQGWETEQENACEEASAEAQETEASEPSAEAEAEEAEASESSAEAEETEASEPSAKAKEAEAPETIIPDKLPIYLPTAKMTTLQVKNLLLALYCKQEILNTSYGKQILTIREEAIRMLSDYTPEDMATFETYIAACQSKNLLEGFYLEDDKLGVTFPFDKDNPNAWHLYNEFLNCLIEEARRANRVIPRLIPSGDNSKYQMNIWLMRMGLKGKVNSELRALLTKNLSGYCAFPSTAKAERHKERVAEMRRIKRELKSEYETRTGGSEE